MQIEMRDSCLTCDESILSKIYTKYSVIKKEVIIRGNNFPVILANDILIDNITFLPITNANIDSDIGINFESY